MDTTLGLAQHYCEMHDYISKYIYSDIGYDCQVLFEEGFWEKIGSAVKTAWKQITKFLAMIWDKAVNLVTNFFAGKSRKIFNELCTKTMERISEMIDWCQKVARKETSNADDDKTVFGRAEKIIEGLNPKKFNAKDTYNDMKEKGKGKYENLSDDKYASLSEIIGKTIQRVSFSPSITEYLNARELKEEYYLLSKLKAKKVNDACDSLDKLKDWYSTDCFPTNPAFFNELGTLNDVGGKYLHYVNQAYKFINLYNETETGKSLDNTVKTEIQTLFKDGDKELKQMDDSKDAITSMLAEMGKVSGQSSIANTLNKLNSILNEAVNTLKNNLGKIETKSKKAFTLDTKYKATDIDSKGDPEVEKFNNESTITGDTISKAFQGLGLVNMYSNLSVTLQLLNEFRAFFVKSRNYFESLYEVYKDEKKDWDDEQKNNKD